MSKVLKKKRISEKKSQRLGSRRNDELRLQWIVDFLRYAIDRRGLKAFKSSLKTRAISSETLITEGVAGTSF